ncbi:hypothetical protein BC937DRAFT_88620 [Endogone sp. FLAS-F59071]|nr:hypothetical protein BC937DRAFT_88620 [Endogone sp. FLAS-F59071]|eukprot:RUS18561.1 hypothetical protein BC937DRAFT_88620 [Endogone sp. FLAS-F59071]
MTGPVDCIGLDRSRTIPQHAKCAQQPTQKVCVASKSLAGHVKRQRQLPKRYRRRPQGVQRQLRDMSRAHGACQETAMWTSVPFVSEGPCVYLLFFVVIHKYNLTNPLLQLLTIQRMSQVLGRVPHFQLDLSDLPPLVVRTQDGG